LSDEEGRDNPSMYNDWLPARTKTRGSIHGMQGFPPTLAQNGSGSHQPTIKWLMKVGVKQQEHESHYSLPTTSEVKITLVRTYIQCHKSLPAP
jgi:hypothetical protein